MRRNHVASTLIRHHFSVMCPLGRVPSVYGQTFHHFHALFQWDQLLKERICTTRCKFFPLRVDQIDGRHRQGKHTRSHKSCFPVYINAKAWELYPTTFKHKRTTRALTVFMRSLVRTYTTIQGPVCSGWPAYTVTLVRLYMSSQGGHFSWQGAYSSQNLLLCFCCCCCLVVLRPRWTSKVMSGRSVNLITLFLVRLRPSKRLTSTSCTYFR